jgi:hypothetical protein
MANPNQDARNSEGRYTRTLEVAERDAEAARLRVKGHTHAQIAEQLGFPSVKAVGYALASLFREIKREPTEELLRIELERLDAELVRLNHLEAVAHQVLAARHITVNNGRVILNPGTDEPMEDDGPILQAIDRLIKIEDARRRNGERRAKLTGIEAAVKVDTTVYEVTQQDIELQEMLRDAKAKVQAQEQQIRDGGDA